MSDLTNAATRTIPMPATNDFPFIPSSGAKQVTTTTKLPDHPGDLIRLAVLDIVASASDTKHFDIEMSDWHVPSEGKCEVCFAGAVMAQSLCADRTDRVDPWTFDKDTERKLLALNNFRTGYLECAFDDLNRPFPEGRLPVVVPVAKWRDNPGLFLADMLDLADMIDKAEYPHA